MAYRYADRGIVWWVDDYISITAAQERQLKSDIVALRDWHCETELVRYSEWLTELKQDIRSGKLHPSRVIYHQQRLESFYTPLVERAKPAIVRLLSSLSSDQVNELADKMAKEQRELEEEYLEEDPEKNWKNRADRSRKRMERWFGSLNDEQILILEQWSKSRGRQTEIWLEGRRKWQGILLETLSKRYESGFAEAIDYIIDNGTELRGEEYQKMIAENRTSMTRLMSALLERADRQQLEFLLDRAANLRSDFRDLDCSGEQAL